MRTGVILTIVMSLGLACASPDAGTGTEAPNGSSGSSSTDTGAGTQALVSTGPRWWVAGGGLRAYDFDGNQIAALGTRGDQARRLPDGHVVALEWPEQGGLGLLVLGSDGAPSVALELPTEFDFDHCSLAAPDPNSDTDRRGVDLQSGRDFSINQAGTHACLDLRDRNENMSDVSITVAVDLATGEVASAVDYIVDDMCPTTSLPVCAETNRATAKLWTEDLAPAAGEPATWAHAYDEETGVLSRAGTPIAELCVGEDQRGEDWEPSYGCVSVEHRSSSGRWLLVSALNDVGGDYIYRQIYLLDLETGAIGSMVCEEDSPCRIEPMAVDQLFLGDESLAYTVVGESELAAMPEDRFWIDGMLVIPETGAVVSIGGSRVLSGG